MTTKTPPGRVPGRPTSEAAAKLRHLLTLDAVDIVARLMEVEPETVREWARGRRRPDPRVRVRLEAVGIPAADWKATPTLDPSAQPPVGAA